MSFISFTDMTSYPSNSFPSILNPSGPTILWSYHLFSPSWTPPPPPHPMHSLPSLPRFNFVISHYPPLTYTFNSFSPCSLCPTYLVRQHPELNQTLWLLPIYTKQLGMARNKYTTMPLFLLHSKFNAKNLGVHVMLLAIVLHFPNPFPLLFPQETINSFLCPQTPNTFSVVLIFN